MSMCLVMCTLSDENIGKLLAYPPLIWKIIAPDAPEAYENARKQPSGFLSRLFGRKKPPAPEVSSLQLAANEVKMTDLDKAWHGIHYLLTGTAWEGEQPLAIMVKGGVSVGDVDVGYGPARAFNTAQVQALSAALAPINDALLKDRFNPSEMMKLEIYPEIWDRDPAQDDTLGYCIEYFGVLKDFVTDSAKCNTGLLVYLS